MLPGSSPATVASFHDDSRGTHFLVLIPCGPPSLPPGPSVHPGERGGGGSWRFLKPGPPPCRASPAPGSQRLGFEASRQLCGEELRPPANHCPGQVFRRQCCLPRSAPWIPGSKQPQGVTRGSLLRAAGSRADLAQSSMSSSCCQRAPQNRGLCPIPGLSSAFGGAETNTGLAARVSQPSLLGECRRQRLAGRRGLSAGWPLLWALVRPHVGGAGGSSQGSRGAERAPRRAGSGAMIFH